MTLSFRQLSTCHLPLLLTWLQKPHVHQWYDSDTLPTWKAVEEKYGPRTWERQTAGAPVRAYIIFDDATPIGYIQSYAIHDIPTNPSIPLLPNNTAGLDFFIGELSYLGKGIGAQVLTMFLKTNLFPQYRYVVVDPMVANVAAVRSFSKAGFEVFSRIGPVFWMLAHNPIVRLSGRDLMALELAFQKNFLISDKLWVFGSRADLLKKGGDLDLYLETFEESVERAVSQMVLFRSDLEQAIGEQKIDIVLNVMKNSSTLEIYSVAKSQGVRIC